MTSRQKGTRVQFRLRTLLWSTMWIGLVLAICIRQQHTSARQREVLETMRATRRIPATAMPYVAVRPAAASASQPAPPTN